MCYLAGLLIAKKDDQHCISEFYARSQNQNKTLTYLSNLFIQTFYILGNWRNCMGDKIFYFDILWPSLVP